MNSRWLFALVVPILAWSCSSSPASPEPVADGIRPVNTSLQAERSGSLAWYKLGHSHQGRPLLATQFGKGNYRVYLIGGIHGDEGDGRQSLDQAIESLVQPGLEGGVTLRVVRDMNPDGSAGPSRYNAMGVDLNRNWPANNFAGSRRNGRSPLSEPETRMVHGDLLEFDPDLVVVFHSSSRGPFVNYDGPAEELAERFKAGVNSTGQEWGLIADMGYPTPGSLGSWIGKDLGLPILTLEFKRGAGSDAQSLRAGLSALLAVAH